MRILIVKTSSLGDIIQSFFVLDYLKKRFPAAEIEWAVEDRFHSIVSSHPLINRTISFNRKGKNIVQSFRNLRQSTYDLVFDLQGNCKSGVVTLLAKAKEKVGFSFPSVREWPNLLATKHRYEVPANLNIRLQYASLIQQHFQDQELLLDGFEGVRFKISEEEQSIIRKILQHPSLQSDLLIMVCAGSKWINKQLPFETLSSFLKKVDQALHPAFLFVWGEPLEKELSEQLQLQFSDHSLVIDRLSLPVWQNLMNEMGLIIAYDSGALHLSATTKAPSFSLFGPTLPEIFKPIGSKHLALRGECPYLRAFTKQCPLLRNCPTGGCIRNLSAESIFTHFWSWWKKSAFQNRSLFRQQ